MRFIFVYKGRYQVRDATTIEYLSAIAARRGHQTALVYDQDIFGVTDNVAHITLLNGICSNDTAVVRKVCARAPDAVVFLDGFSRSRWNSEIARRVKEKNGAIATVGIFHSLRESDRDGYDYLLAGEPEQSFWQFLDEDIIEKSPGTYEFKKLIDLDTLPLPDKDLFAPYVNFSDSYLVYTSKGCPYHCSYCEETVYKKQLGTGYFRRRTGYFRRRSPHSVIEELKRARERFKIKEVIYKDSLFAWDKSWLGDYLERYRREIDVPYKCFAKAGNFDDALAAMLKESKCYCVEFGLQTFNEKLKAAVLKRNETTQSFLRAIAVCDTHRLRYDIDHIFGIPGESIDDHFVAAEIYSRLPFINRIKCHNLTFYPEAEIFEHAPERVKKDAEYSADFFSSVAGEGAMKQVNKAFQKYFKILPLLPRRFNEWIIKKRRWRFFNYVPSCVVFLLMLVLAVKNGDKRFGVYMKYYPLKLLTAWLRR